jgi:hypothetical protein
VQLANFPAADRGTLNFQPQQVNAIGHFVAKVKEVNLAFLLGSNRSR